MHLQADQHPSYDAQTATEQARPKSRHAARPQSYRRVIAPLLSSALVLAAGISAIAQQQPQGVRKIDFGDNGIDPPAPTPPKTDPAASTPTPAHTDPASPTPVEPPAVATAKSTLQPPLGVAANFVGTGPLEGVAFVWDSKLIGWRSYSTATLGGAAPPSPDELSQVGAQMRQLGLLLPGFHLTIDADQHFIIGPEATTPPLGGGGRGDAPRVIRASAGLAGMVFTWSDKSKGWVTGYQLRQSYDSPEERDNNIRAAVRASGFPKGSSFYFTPDGKVVVSPP